MFTVRANQHVLMRILNLADSTGKLGRERRGLMKYEFDTVYRGAIKHKASGVISGLSSRGTDDFDFFNEIRILAVARQPLKRLRTITNTAPGQNEVETNVP